MAGIVARAGVTAAGPRHGRMWHGRRSWHGRVTEEDAPPARRPRPLVLAVLDGFGIGRDPAAMRSPPRTCRPGAGCSATGRMPTLRASEDAVGLPPGQMGNSEVGHLNLGAGRPVLQDLPRIDAAIADRSFFDRPAFLVAARDCEGLGTALDRDPARPGRRPCERPAHDRPGRATTDQVERSIRHLDGRDTPPSSALEYAVDLERRLAAAHPDAAIASVGGRYWAMDRDQRWDRVERGYDAIVHSEAGHEAGSATAAIAAGYARGETDESVVPTVVGAARPIETGEPVVHANFRADRARQLTHALADGPAFTAFDRTSPAGRPAPTDLLVVTMTDYEAGLPVHVAFPPEESRSIAQAISEAGWRQFHVAETEKYAHVTYFFNGGVETPYPGEDRLLVPSPRSRPTTSLRR